MKETLHKYQSEYENSRGCFWEKRPASYVRLFMEKYATDLHGKKILDIGAGEGKNAVWLANLGAMVIAIDVSPIALKRFEQQPDFENCKKRITRIQQSMTDAHFPLENFDIIVAYGVLHCLDSRDEIFEMLSKIRNWLKPGGFFICASFTDAIPVPSIQDYLNEKSFLKEGELEGKLSGFIIMAYENGVITETHSTSNIEHQHSIVRIIAQKNENI